MEHLGSLSTMLLPLHMTAELSHLPSSTGFSHPLFAEDHDGLSSSGESLSGTESIFLSKKEKLGALLHSNNWWLFLGVFDTLVFVQVWFLTCLQEVFSRHLF